MSQRVMIAMALSCEPDLMIADEPTTALDVTIQAQIMELMLAIKEQRNSGILLITHDLGVVAEMCTRVVVMYAGRIVGGGSCNGTIRQPCASVYRRSYRVRTQDRQRSPDSAVHSGKRAGFVRDA